LLAVAGSCWQLLAAAAWQWQLPLAVSSLFFARCWKLNCGFLAADLGFISYLLLAVYGRGLWQMQLLVTGSKLRAKAIGASWGFMVVAGERDARCWLASLCLAFVAQFAAS
jgi:hypothetical protein